MHYERPKVTRVESAIAVIQSMSKIQPPHPDAEQKLTVGAYEADE